MSKPSGKHLVKSHNAQRMKIEAARTNAKGHNHYSGCQKSNSPKSRAPIEHPPQQTGHHTDRPAKQEHLLNRNITPKHTQQYRKIN